MNNKLENRLDKISELLETILAKLNDLEVDISMVSSKIDDLD